MHLNLPSKESLTHAAVQVDATDLPEWPQEACWGLIAVHQQGCGFHALWMGDSFLRFRAVKKRKEKNHTCSARQEIPTC